MLITKGPKSVRVSALTQFNQGSIRPIIIIVLFIGGYLGRDKTREKVSSKTKMKDVHEFVKMCDV